MNAKCIISNFAKVLSHFLVVLGLVLFPPTAMHAQSGTHGEGHTNISALISLNSEHSAHAEATDAFNELDAGLQSSSESDAESDECCNFTCVTVTLTGDSFGSNTAVQGAQNVIPTTQSNEVNSTGFLRPPRHLI